MLHIADGESVAGTLRESGIPGVVSIYGDLMFEGPAPTGLDAETWRETRARFMAGAEPSGVHATPRMRVHAACSQVAGDLVMCEFRADHDVREICGGFYQTNRKSFTYLKLGQ